MGCAASAHYAISMVTFPEPFEQKELFKTPHAASQSLAGVAVAAA